MYLFTRHSNPIITGSVSSTGVAISDITMLFGTYLIAPGEITDLQIETSRTMQSLLLDFVKDSWLVLAGCRMAYLFPEYDKWWYSCAVWS
jgi:hypothetical protein